MKNRALTVLLATALFVASFAAIFKITPANAPPGGVVWTVPGAFPTLEATINSGLVMNNDEIHILPGHMEALTGPLVIPQNNFWIIGPPPGLGPIPMINVNGFGITILGANVFMWGLDIFDPIGISSPILALAPSSVNSLIMNNVITGAAPPNIGIIIAGMNNIVELNTISTCGICIQVLGPASGNSIRLNTINPPLMLGIQVTGMAGAPMPNYMYWNNMFAPPEFVDTGPPGPPNFFDDTSGGGPGFNKGNFWVTMPPAPAPIPGPNGWLDWFPQPVPMMQLQGDINVDGQVDIFDIVIVATNFSRVWCTLGWDPRADLNGDGIVDIFDIVVIALNFSASY